MTKVDVIVAGPITEEVIITTPQPSVPPPSTTPDVGLVELTSISAKGDKGDTGERGSRWYEGEQFPQIGMPGPTGRVDGDQYLKTADPNMGSVWRWDAASSSWVFTGSNLTGPPGADSTVPGPQGEPGVDGVDGAQGIPGEKGDKGDPGEVPEAPQDGKTYGRKDASWVDIITGGTASVIVSDVPPATPALPNITLWWESDSGVMFLDYDDGNTRQWVQVNGGMPGKDGKDGLNAVKTAHSRNLLVNPNGQISQENGRAAGNTTSFYIADQWRFDVNGTTLVQAQSVDGPPSYMRQISTATGAAPAAGAFAYILQAFEGIRVVDLKWGTPDAIPAVLRFKARTPHASFAQNCGVTLRNPGGARSFTHQILVSPAWQVFTVPIPPCTDGTWPTDNTACLSVGFAVIVGSTYVAPIPDVWQNGNYLGTGQHNVLSTVGTGLDITEISLHADPDNTGLAPPFQTPDYAEMTRDCQRYYEKVGMTVVNSANPGVPYDNTAWYKASKRAAPTLSILLNPAGATVGPISATQLEGCRQLTFSTSPADINVVANARM